MTATPRSSGYRNYTTDGTYWTVRKYQGTFWVVRIEKVGGVYEWREVWGGYQNAGSAGGAAAQLAYGQAVADTTNRVRGALHGALEEVGLGVPVPSAPPVPPGDAPNSPEDDEGVTEGE